MEDILAVNSTQVDTVLAILAVDNTLEDIARNLIDIEFDLDILGE